MTATSADSARPPSAAPAKPVYSVNYKRLVLALLVTAYTFNFIDRTIIATIGQAIKEDLKITDAQLGLLGGLYFALLYTFLGIPLARLAERFSRVNIIAAAIVIWSGFTALCGVAANFLSLSAFRFGVGVGEAGLSPSAHSLISDYFEPKRRASALAVYSFGIPLGSMIGAVAGGWLAQNFSWRVAFLLVGLPGVLVALAIKLLIKEPPRGHSDPAPLLEEAPRPEAVAVDKPPPPSLAAEFREMGAVIATLFGKWPVLNMVLGVTLASFAGYGGGQFAPPYFIRAFGLDYTQVGLLTGLVGGASAGLGTLIGGFLTDRLARRSPTWYALLPALGLTVAFPCFVAVYTAPTWQIAGAFLLLPGIFSYVYLGPTFGVVQNMVPTRRRATATAILFFFLNLIALGGGPPFTGWMIDQLAAFHFAHPDTPGAFAALSGMFGDFAPFKAACPGGIAPPAAGADVAAACKGSLVLATRQGVIVAYAFGLWGALHYFLGCIGLKAALAKARADRGEGD